MTYRNPNLCRSCVLLRADKTTCDAFPGGIPDEIRVYGGDHLDPVPGDGGITYRRAKTPEAQQDYRDWSQTR